MSHKNKIDDDDERLNDVRRKTFEVQKVWAAFHREVTKALVANGAKRGEATGVGSDRIGCSPTIDKAMADCERASTDFDGPPDYDRAERLCQVVVLMIEREWPKFNSDPKGWVARHWPELIPEPKAERLRRWGTCNEA